jgi:hypothetical protein
VQRCDPPFNALRVAYAAKSGHERYVALADDLVLRAVRDLLARRGRGAGTPCLQAWSAMAGRHGSNDINGYLKGLLGEKMHRAANQSGMQWADGEAAGRGRR